MAFELLPVNPDEVIANYDATARAASHPKGQEEVLEVLGPDIDLGTRLEAVQNVINEIKKPTTVGFSSEGYARFCRDTVADLHYGGKI